MSNVYFISDLHFGHRKIIQFAGDYREGDDYLENMHCIIGKWNKRIKKRDTVYVLGDVAFSPEGLYAMQELKGIKYLVRGNHDQMGLDEYLQVFNDIYGIRSYKGYWLSHAPIHPVELRGRKNIHGHVHQNTVLDQHGEIDTNYINVCVETNGGVPVSMHEIKEGIHIGKARPTILVE